jgi:hypothetical protein
MDKRMRHVRHLTLAVGAVTVCALAPATGIAAARPGPPLLYAWPPAVSPLSSSAPFSAPPLLVSGTDAYRDGEYLYQDYLFDDRGADTAPGSGTRVDNGNEAATPTAGDVQYPTADRYGGNAADLVEFRVKPLDDAIVYRITLNTARAPDAAVVGIGIDSDRSGGLPVLWPHAAGISSPGLDSFITAWGTGGEVQSLPAGTPTPLPAGAVSMNTDTNQMTIRVPRSMMDPGSATWRYVAGTGLWAGSGWKPVPAGLQSTAEQAASGNPLTDAPAVYNLAFRFNEPQGPSNPSYTTIPGVGNWFEDGQAAALAQRTSGAFHADIDFAKLAANADATLHAAGRIQARIYASQFEPNEGVRHSQLDPNEAAGRLPPGYGTRLQPYILVVPPSAGDHPRLTLALHPGNSSYAVYAVNDPNLYREFGDDRKSLVLTPFGRAPNTNYTGSGEADVIEALGDVERHFDVDRSSLAIAGYSMGGYGAYRLAVRWPDLFGRLWTGVGLPADQGWAPPLPPSPGGQVSNTNPLLENLRWVPVMQWAQVADELNFYTGARAQQDRFTALGLRSQLWTYTSGDHFLQSIQDQWTPAAQFLGAPHVTDDPSRVDYAFLPQADAPEFGLRPDHAYWVSGLRARDTSGDPQTAPARAEIDARSRAFGEGQPVTSSFKDPAPQTAAPTPTLIEGTTWTGIPKRTARNAVGIRLENIAAATVDGDGARLNGSKPLRVRITSDGVGRVRLELPFASGATVRIVGGPAPLWSAQIDANGVTFSVAAGTKTFVVR